MKPILVILSFLFVTHAIPALAMPHDQPELKYFSDKDVAVGLVFSDGTDYSTNATAHRLLQQIYVCQSGTKIADFANFKTVVDSSGYMLIAKEKSGGVIKLENSGDELRIIISSLAKLKVDATESVDLKLTLSGISGFELDWSNPCAPTPIDN